MKSFRYLLLRWREWMILTGFGELYSTSEGQHVTASTFDEPSEEALAEVPLSLSLSLSKKVVGVQIAVGDGRHQGEPRTPNRGLR